MALPKQTQVQSYINALKGIAAVVKNELHMKIHLVFAVFALVACGVLRVDYLGWCLVLLCIGAVFAAELFNSALEALCDEVTQEFSPRIKLAKDAAAGAVLVLACISVAVGLTVYIPALLSLVG